MGIESRDWYREESRRRGAGSTPTWVWVVGAIIAVAVLSLISPTARHRVGIHLPFGLEQVFGRDRSGGFLVLPLAGGPPISLGGSLYAADDPWREWLAPESACPRGEDRDVPDAAQAQVLLCLVNYARARQGLEPVALSPLLSEASAAKAGHIQRCREFAHEPCGEPANAAALALGYAGSFGENLYIAEGLMTSPRVAVDQWLNSPGHRESLLRPEWRIVGIARLDGVSFGPFSGAVLWVNEFGDRYVAGRPSV